MDPKEIAELVAAALGMEPTTVIMYDANGDVIEAMQMQGELPQTTHTTTHKLQ